MSEPNEEAWKDQYSGRERVRMVVEILDEPETVSAIADRADVVWATADSELETLVDENKAVEHTVDGQKNTLQTLFKYLLTKYLTSSIITLVRSSNRLLLNTPLRLNRYGRNTRSRLFPNCATS